MGGRCVTNSPLIEETGVLSLLRDIWETRFVVLNSMYRGLLTLHTRVGYKRGYINERKMEFIVCIVSVFHFFCYFDFLLLVWLP
jgi:hypothetical protein